MDRRKDPYYTRAKAEQYRSRAAYKLLEIQRRYRVLRAGDRVIDLGAAPGAWLQVAASVVGAGGRVVGVDLVDIPPLREPHVICLRADVTEAATRSRVLEALGGAPDVVLSDMAPKLSGVRPRDEARCAELVEVAVDFAVTTLAPGGRLIVKLLTGADLSGVIADARARFRTAKLTRPDATRKGSTESYLVAIGLARTPA
jgi:23S rRNA (uridine2552-2'-O)-methyltransferase